MTYSRLFSVAFVVAAASGAAIVACGGDSKTGTDAKVFQDAPRGSGSGSGSGSNNVTGLGQHCNPGSGAGLGQGDCPGGYTCMNLNGGHDTWCSKPCTAGSGDMCNTGYTGPGEGACIYRITVGSGAAMNYCGIVCALAAGSAACPNCNDTCPGSLTCSATLTSGSGSAVGSACL
jgi:hypothetical protein